MLTDTENAFGDYTLHQTLGRGGMAETFVASRRMGLGTEPKVCLKRILPGLCDDASIRAMFFLEAKLSARLHHGNIVRVVDFGEVDGTAFLALELVDGIDLRKLMSAASRAGERLEDSVLAEVAFALGCALSFAHAVSEDGVFHGLVHRDVSPSNVLVSEAGDIKLADFGIAKAVGQSVHTRTGTLKGKIPYMPPEYAREGKYDARSDLFALGVTLYEACAQVRPFQGANEVETLELITRGAFVPLADRAELALPPVFARAVDKLLAHDPKDRYPDATAFVHDIADIGRTTEARTRIGERVRAARAEAKERAARRAAERQKTETLIEQTQALGGVASAREEPSITRAGPDEETR